MKVRKFIIPALVGLALFTGSCSKNEVVDPVDGGTTPTGNVVEVTGDIKTATTWKADKIYLLKGFVFVTDGAELTIEPGTIIKGDKATKGTLIVTRGSKINAVGTAEQPIVFTSNLGAGARREGDWGGIIILGKAPVNQGTDVKIEGGLTPTGNGDEKKYISYGGTDAADNSGKLKYVRIEFGGISFSPDNEINGLTLGGVGSGTEIDYVQVYRSGDDSFEFFGGTVNAKHLLAIGSWDDDFDTDFGYSGKIQFALSQRYPTVADISGSNGFESDNDGSGSDKTPQTSAVFSNVTILGPLKSGSKLSDVNQNFQHAVQIRRNSAISAYNSVFVGYTEGVYIDASKVTTPKSTIENYLQGRLGFANNLVLGANIKGNEVKGDNADNKALFETALRTANTFDASLLADAVMTDPYKYASDFKNPGTPNFTVKTGSAAASGAKFTDAKVADAFFEKVDYRGAFGTTDWSAGWANFDPQTLPYDAPGKVK
ncbi:hypothetical protein [Rubrolithibacter danxiaensis]|uniref:hypothetical protein n=1 Tax=Rubrolithibacter danxiaensis TaxID=3390805 RepID=UPI003BF8340A